MTDLKKTVVMDEAAVKRSLVRIAHEIIESNNGAQNIALAGIVTRGDLLAAVLARHIETIEGIKVPVGRLDISFYRDDIDNYLAPVLHATDITFSLEGKTIVIVDDVLYTGRTIRAALDALCDFGRPDRVQLAVLVDRGHRELPIRADFVGKNIPSRSNESVRFFCKPLDGRTSVEIFEADEHVGSAPIEPSASLTQAFNKVLGGGK